MNKLRNPQDPQDPQDPQPRTSARHAQRQTREQIQKTYRKRQGFRNRVQVCTWVPERCRRALLEAARVLRTHVISDTPDTSEPLDPSSALVIFAPKDKHTAIRAYADELHLDKQS